jgi:hypothetical protein
VVLSGDPLPGSDRHGGHRHLRLEMALDALVASRLLQR